MSGALGGGNPPAILLTGGMQELREPTSMYKVAVKNGRVFRVNFAGINPKCIPLNAECISGGVKTSWPPNFPSDKLPDYDHFLAIFRLLIQGGR